MTTYLMCLTSHLSTLVMTIPSGFTRPLEHTALVFHTSGLGLEIVPTCGTAGDLSRNCIHLYICKLIDDFDNQLFYFWCNQ